MIADYDIFYLSVAQLMKQPSPYNRKKWVWIVSVLKRLSSLLITHSCLSTAK